MLPQLTKYHKILKASKEFDEQFQILKLNLIDILRLSFYTRSIYVYILELRCTKFYFCIAFINSDFFLFDFVFSNIKQNGGV